MKYTIAILLSGFLLTSCGSLSKQTLKNVEQIKTKEQEAKVITQSLEKKSKVYVDASLRALEVAPKSKETTLALQLLRSTQEIMGPPLPSERINVTKVFAQDPEELRKLATTEKLYQEELIKRQQLNEELSKLKDEVVVQAEKLAEIQNKSWFTKLKENIATYIVLLVSGALLAIFFPTLLKLAIKIIKPV